MLPAPTHPWEDLRYDFVEVRDVFHNSWKDSAEVPVEYGPEFFQSFFAYPGMRPFLAPALYSNGALTAFTAAFPRSAQIGGRPANLAMITFFTVAAGSKGRGLGTGVWAECLRRIQSAGFAGAIHYCLVGHQSNTVTAAGARLAGLASRKIFTAQFLMRPLRPGASAAALVKPAVSDLTDLGQTVQATVRRSWTPDEAHWQLTRQGAISHLLERDGRRGVLTGYIAAMADRNRTRCLLVEDIFWGDLQDAERQQLLSEFLTVAAQDAEIAVVPDLGYADMEPFRGARFRLSRRVLNTYLTMCDGSVPPEAENVYMDVI